MRILPLFISKNLGIRLIKVDFPAPLSPTKATVSPSFILKLISFKIGLSLNENETFENSISALLVFNITAFSDDLMLGFVDINSNTLFPADNPS